MRRFRVIASQIRVSRNIDHRRGCWNVPDGTGSEIVALGWNSPLMRIAIFTTEFGRGGASAAAMRLTIGLRQLGHVVDVFCLRAGADEAGVIILYDIAADAPEGALDEARDRYIAEDYIGAHRTPVSNTLFTIPLRGFQIDRIPDLDCYDVFNVHWVANFLSIAGIESLIATGKPTVVTLHDMNPITGGCHYSAGCRAFEANCLPCPQLDADPLQLPARVLAQRRLLAKQRNYSAVCPSAWLARQVSASGAFAADHIHHIDNSLDTDVFSPMPMAAARLEFGLPPDPLVIALGAQDNGELRKGFDNVINTLATLRVLPDVPRDRIFLLIFGQNGDYLKNRGFKVKSLGMVHNDRALVTAYAAADLFLLPSLEDNQPNVMLEAMACGTPVASFEIGGMADVIIDGVNGILKPAFDTEAMAMAVAALVDRPPQLARMRAAARRLAETRFTLRRQALLYQDLFRDLMTEAAVVSSRVP